MPSHCFQKGQVFFSLRCLKLGEIWGWAPVQKPQLKRNSTRQSPYWDDRATPPWKASNVSNGSGMQGPPPAGVKIMKKAGAGQTKNM